jgi:hypothetical protein
MEFDRFSERLCFVKLTMGPSKPLSANGILPDGTTSDERMHKVRHATGQRVREATENPKAAQS